MTDQLKNFITAFRDPMVGFARECQCGKTFYNTSGDWDWEEGELEALDADCNAILLDDPVATVTVNGKEYVTECDCWKHWAENTATFLWHYRQEVAEFYRREKNRLEAIARSIPRLEPEDL